MVSTTGKKGKGDGTQAKPKAPKRQAGVAKDRQSSGSDDSRSKFRLKSFKGVALLVVILCGIVGAGLYWWRSTFWVSTDDAQIDGYINPISARITGHLLRVNVNENDRVEAGMVLVEIDPTEYQIAYEQAQAAYNAAVAAAQAASLNVQLVSTDTESTLSEAQAAYDNAQIAVEVAQKQLEAAKADLQAAQAENEKAQLNFKRYTVLFKQKVVGSETYEKYRAAAKTSAAAVTADRAHVTAYAAQVQQAKGQQAQAKARLQAARTRPDQVSKAQAQAKNAQATVKQRKADLDQARLNLTYTKVIAPVTGIVGPKTAEVGQNVVPGQQLLYIVPLAEVWVTANFKETDLKRIRPGQPVKIHVDAYDRDYNGHVASIGGATGAQFSLFPPENATGNYVKVVQRVPVKIVFDKGQDREHRLRPGMSVEPKVRVKP